jgi:hypothetical protein
LRSADGDLGTAELSRSDRDEGLGEGNLSSSVDQGDWSEVRLSSLLREGQRSLSRDVGDSVRVGRGSVVLDGDGELGDGVEGVVKRDLSGGDERLEVDGGESIDESSTLLDDGVEKRTLGGSSDA